jgi:hypothetical protein
MLGITDPQKGRKYKWVFAGAPGFFVTHARMQGWVPVQGDDPEAQERKWVDSTRKLGDTILFWISEEKYKKIEAEDFARRMMQQNSITSQIEEEGQRLGVPVVRAGKNDALLRRLQQQAFARQMAEQKFQDMLKSGKIPGMETKR